MGFFGGLVRGLGSIAKAAIPGGFDDILIDAIIPGKKPGTSVMTRGIQLPGDFGGCTSPMVRDQSGICVFPGSPGDVSTGRTRVATGGQTSFVVPDIDTVHVDRCPRFANGKIGILWMSAMTGEVVCLPRGANGSAFGLIRKNKPRRKPYISAAQKKSLDDISKVQNKAKEFATAAGWSCTTGSKRLKGTAKKKK